MSQDMKDFKEIELICSSCGAHFFVMASSDDFEDARFCINCRLAEDDDQFSVKNKPKKQRNKKLLTKLRF